MLLKFLICTTLICFAVADVKTYFLSGPDKPLEIIQTEEDIPDLATNEIVKSNLKSENFETFTKEASKDPLYGNTPFGYNGYPGNFPGAFPNQGFPGLGFLGQTYPRPVFPPQPFPAHGPVFPPSPGFVNPGIPPQGYPGQVYPGQGFPPQSYPGQVYPAPGFINPGFPAQGFPNYPVYFSAAEKLQAEQNENNKDNKLLVRTIDNDTEYDKTNGGYVYNKPRVAF